MKPNIPVRDIIEITSHHIKASKQLLIHGIKTILEEKTTDDHTFIELNSPVTINMYRQSTEEIVRIYRDGGLVVNQSSQGRMDIEDTIDDLNVSQLFDLLIALEENGINEKEVA